MTMQAYKWAETGVISAVTKKEMLDLADWLDSMGGHPREVARVYPGWRARLLRLELK